MRLPKGKQIVAPVLIAGVPAKNTRFEVTVLDCIHEGEHFHIYRGVDANEMHVCIKSIRYRSERKDTFHSAQEYVAYRRKTLLSEHSLLNVSHPCLPTPLAMIMLENDSLEDKRLFKNAPEWEALSHEEPVLIKEYFSGSSLDQLTDKLKEYSISRRLALVSRVAKVCLFMHRQGYILQNLHPSHILIKPRNDDNINIVGLHNACVLKNGRADTSYPSYKSVPHGHFMEEVENDGHNYDQRVDVFQLGMLVYYLLTFHDPCQEGNWWKKGTSGQLELSRLEKAISDNPGFMWIRDLVVESTQPLPELRIPDVETFLDYLQTPPDTRLSFQIKKATQEETEISISNIPHNLPKILVRMECSGNQEIFQRDYLAGHSLSLPGVPIGKMFCSIAGTDGTSLLTWWEHQSANVMPEIKLQPKENASPDRFGFTWGAVPNLHHIHFTVTTANGTKIELGDFVGNEVELPPESIVLPFHENLLVECIPYFQTSTSLVPSNTISCQKRIVPPIPPPTYRKIDEGVEFEMKIPSKQAEIYQEVELLHNGWPKTPRKVDVKATKTEKRYAFLLSYEDIDLFETHHFAFRVLIENLGWKMGSSVMVSPSMYSVTNLNAVQEKLGWVKIVWSPIPHHQIESYEIKCDGKMVARTKTSSYLWKLPLDMLLNKSETEISVHAIYGDSKAEKVSAPASYKLKLSGDTTKVHNQVRPFISPFFAAFQIDLTIYDFIEGTIPSLVFHRKNEKEKDAKVLGQYQLQRTMLLKDTDVEVGASYQYLITVDELGLCLLDHKVTIPEITINCNLSHVGYEDLVWEIDIAPETAAYLKGDITVLREGEDGKHPHTFTWSEEEGSYYLEETGLLPGVTYTYTLTAHFKERQDAYTKVMGTVTTKKFDIQETVQSYYNRATLSWTPSPAGQIDAISIYEGNGRFIADTKSDCITLENLEPQRKYNFVLKYRYLSGKVVDGRQISFNTLPYEIETKASDVGIDSFRIHWEIPDLSIARRIREFNLEVSGDVGKHTLSPGTRSVYLKQLYPCTLYEWTLYATLKSGVSVLLSKGKTETLKPAFTSNVEVGLIHYLSWRYDSCPAIEKLEVHRDDVPLLQTTENELYDSDFKGGKEIVYKFYYLLKDSRHILADEKTVQPLSMANLYSALQIEPGVGSIKWDFENLKNFKYFKYIELYQNDQILYKRGSHLSSLVFKDMGAMGENNHYLGLSDEPMSFKLAVVGVAPTAAKCKKKWTLNIKGIRCFYSDLPYCFSVAPEHCCIYFDWEYSDTELLKEIVLRRAGDGLVIYQGANQAATVADDNQGKGLEQNRKYAYTIEMVYNNYRTSKVIEVNMGQFDPSRLEIKTRMVGDILEITWNNQLSTSISKIGWRRVSSRGLLGKTITGMFNRPTFSEFCKGILTIPVQNPLVNDFIYQLVYQDRYGHIFDTPPQMVPRM